MTPVSELISVRHTDLYIGGSWRPASDQQRIEVSDPATGEVIATVASASVQDALAAVDAASEAFPGWAAKAPRQRAEILRKAFELMMRDQEKLAELMVRENGKPMVEARGEVAYAAEFFRWFSEEAVRNIGSVSISPSGANRILVEHQPIGVSVLVTPWNFPAAMATRKIGPALAAGCTVILKPASETPLTAQAAESVISCSMELGGNAPFIVLADADLDAALEGALVAKMRNTGQSCIAANRFYVQAPIAEKFSTMLAQAMGALPVGSGMDPNVKVGPVINQPAREKMLALVDEAAGHGARLLTGGKPSNRAAYFVPPTVLSEVPPDEHILKEEIFGPIAPVVTFREVNEAIDFANTTDRGLASYVYTRDLAKGLAIAEAIESGMVGLNRGFISDPAAPFGGVKQSGVGREGSHEGLMEFLETKYIATNW